MSPINSKGEKILGSMEKEYGSKKGKQVFYASKNKGTIHGVEGAKSRALKHVKNLENVRKVKTHEMF